MVVGLVGLLVGVGLIGDRPEAGPPPLTAVDAAGGDTLELVAVRPHALDVRGRPDRTVPLALVLVAVPVLLAGVLQPRPPRAAVSPAPARRAPLRSSPLGRRAPPSSPFAT